MSNEDTPQSETSITVNTNNPMVLVGGSNEIVRLPMRGYFPSNGGKSWSQVTYFNFNSGNDKFNDKPMIAVDTNLHSPFRDSVYVGWDTVTSGKSSANDDLLFARSTDGGLTFSNLVAVNNLN